MSNVLHQAVLNFPYYELEVSWSGPDGGTSMIQLWAENVDGNPNQGPSPDDVADALRDWYASRPNYSSSTLKKREFTETAL